MKIFKLGSCEIIISDGNMRMEPDTHTNSITNPSSMGNPAIQVQLNQELISGDSGDSPALDQIGSEGELFCNFLPLKSIFLVSHILFVRADIQ